MGFGYIVWFYRNDKLQKKTHYLSVRGSENAKKFLLESKKYSDGEIQNVEMIL